MYFNPEFLSKFSPTKTALSGITLWGLIYVGSSLESNTKNITVTVEAVIFLVLSIVCFLIGAQIGRITILKRGTTFITKGYDYTNDQKLNLFYILFFIASIGLSILLVDRFLVRGVSLSNDMLQNREKLESSSGFLSIIAAVLTPFCLIPIFLVYQLQLENRKIIKILSFVLLSIPAFLHFLLGSRSGIIVIILYLFIYLFYFRRISLSLKKLIVLAVIGSVLFMLMTHIFVKRTEEFTSKPYYHIIHNSGITFTLKASPALETSILKSKSVISKYFYLSYLNFTQYYLHGVYEFFYLYENFNGKHANGKYTFFIYYKFISKVIGEDSDIKERVSLLAPRKGIYTTFFGPVFIDFGWYTMLFMFIFGFIQTKVYLKVKKNKFYLLPLYFYLVIINLFLPVFNFINGAQGLYFITSFLFFAAMCKILQSRIIIRKDQHSTTILRFI